MADVRHERRFLHPRLSHVLSGLAGSPLPQALADRVAEVGASAPPSPKGKALWEALAAHLWLLERAGSTEGLPLTASGWMKPATITEFMTVLPTAADWIHSATREIDVDVVSDFRATLQNFRLLRKFKNSLRLTKAGEAALADPDDLWTSLVERLVPSDDDFTGSVGAVILVHMATSGDRVDMGAVARTMAEAGWKDRDGLAATADELWPIYNSLWTLIGNVGPRDGESRRDRTPSDAARAMIRDALFLSSPPDL